MKHNEMSESVSENVARWTRNVVTDYFIGEIKVMHDIAMSKLLSSEDGKYCVEVKAYKSVLDRFQEMEKENQ